MPSELQRSADLQLAFQIKHHAGGGNIGRLRGVFLMIRLNRQRKVQGKADGVAQLRQRRGGWRFWDFGDHGRLRVAPGVSE